MVYITFLKSEKKNKKSRYNLNKDDEGKIDKGKKWKIIFINF